MTRLRHAVLLGALWLGCHVAHAQSEQAQSGQAKAYFAAGATAYTAGDYQAAVQAFDAAYRLQPLAAIAFSLAQAERRQYFVSQDVAHLSRAIELYRVYLLQVQSGGRRADATDALGQLEPIAIARSSEHSEPRPSTADAQTRLMVRCQAPGARIALDAGGFVAAPLITETTAGPHRVRIEAAGFYAAEQQVTAVAGELVPIEVTLRDRPALLIVKKRDGAELYVDGARARVRARVAPADAADSVTLRAGRHNLAFAKKGHYLYTQSVALARGETREVTAELHWTGQRIAALTLFAVGTGALLLAAANTGYAVYEEGKAHDLERARHTRALTPSERDEYAETVRERDRSRIVAISGMAIGATALLTGLLLHQLDDPDPRARSTVQVALAPVNGAGLSIALLGRL